MKQSSTAKTPKRGERNVVKYNDTVFRHKFVLLLVLTIILMLFIGLVVALLSPYVSSYIKILFTGYDWEEVNGESYIEENVVFELASNNEDAPEDTISLDRQKFTGTDVTYTGRPQKISYSESLPDGYTLEYVNNDGKVNVGTYQVHAVLVYDGRIIDRCENIELVISPATFDVKFDSETVPYSASAQTLLVQGLPNDSSVKVSYSYKDQDGNDQEFIGATAVGEYVITAKISDEDGNYIDLSLDATLTIRKALINVVLVENSFVYSGTSYTPTFRYTGEAKNEIHATSLGNISVSGNVTEKNAGNYSITIDIAGNENYEPLLSEELSWSISPKNVIASFNGINEKGNVFVYFPGFLPFLASSATVEELVLYGSDKYAVKYLYSDNYEKYEFGNLSLLKPGIYRVKAEIDAGNNYTIDPIECNLIAITVNITELIIILAISLALAILLSILNIIQKNIIESISKSKYKSVHTKLLAVRGNLVCQSIATARRSRGSDRKGGKGRMYLSATAIEFYNKKFAKKPENNFVIHTANILKTETGGIKNNKLYIYCADGTVQTFVVPIGTATKWEHQVLITKNNAQYLVRNTDSASEA